MVTFVEEEENEKGPSIWEAAEDEEVEENHWCDLSHSVTLRVCGTSLEILFRREILPPS